LPPSIHTISGGQFSLAIPAEAGGIGTGAGGGFAAAELLASGGAALAVPEVLEGASLDTDSESQHAATKSATVKPRPTELIALEPFIDPSQDAASSM